MPDETKPLPVEEAKDIEKRTKEESKVVDVDPTPNWTEEKEKKEKDDQKPS